ncbi:E3 ubiquitin protein ligase RIN2-like [Silene latifolia]|uniref:E3 ubiquitin protein ligase RIN2-like n=1 Tax=Silene latifolia TaxID=37657 RepID=UPI003D76CFA2
MGVSYLAISAVCTVVSFIGLQCWAEISLDNFKSDGLIDRDTLYSENAYRIVELLLRSHTTITFLAVCVINVFVLVTLCLKTVFFGELYASETRKLVERLVNYIIYKGTFLPLVIPPTIFQGSLWVTWLTVLCFLKMFQALARDRLERLNASPSATPWTYFRVYSALLFVLTVDFLWVWFCAAVSGPLISSTYWLLFFEPLSIAFETLQAMVVHGFQLMDIWLHHSAAETSDSQRSKLLDSTAGSLWEWKSNIVRNVGFLLDMMTLLMALGHYVLIWFLHGMTFHLVDALIFLNIRALLSAVLKRVKGFIKLKIALGALHEALPDASSEEILAYDDECAICREPMAKAKRLPCKHLFHLACLRSWLDQGLNEVYSCPTCRKPLFAGQSESEASSNTTNVSSDEQLARQLSAGLDLPNVRGLGGVFPSQNPNSIEPGPWRETGSDPHWLQPWPSQGLDGAGPSTAIRSVGLGRVQMMMRHLASVGENYAQTALEDTSWNLWPGSTSQGSTSGTAFPPAAQRYPAPTTVHRRVTSNPANDSIANLLAMAETVREVLPHVPDEIIFQDLQQTNSVAVTVNNLLQM